MLLDINNLTALSEKVNADLIFDDGAVINSLHTNERAKNCLMLLHKAEQKNGAVAITYGRWSLHHFIIATVQKIGKCKIAFTSYSLSEEPCRALHKLHSDNLITSIHCLLEERYRSRKPKVFAFLSSFASVGLTSCHAKIFVAVGETQSIVYIGSHNMTTAHRLEACTISFSSELANELYDFITNAVSTSNLDK